MKKTKIITLILLICTGCAGLSNYRIDISNQFAIANVSQHDVKFFRKVEESGLESIVGPKIVEANWNERTVILKQQLIHENEPTDEYQYWIFFLENEELQGPLNEQEFEDNLEQINVELKLEKLSKFR